MIKENLRIKKTVWERRKYEIKETILINDYQSSNGELWAVSFTIAPLVEVDGHYERVSAEAARYKESTPSPKEKFVMYTTISGGTSDLAAEKEYVARTYGTWENLYLGGATYPAPVEDFIFQTHPNTFTTHSTALYAVYDYEPIVGREGKDYWLEDAGDSYVKYKIYDDPAGYRQLNNFTLATVNSGPVSNTARQIRSTYVHTWKAVTFNISVSVSNPKNTVLTITPSIEERSWQLTNFVTFDF